MAQQKITGQQVTLTLNDLMDVDAATPNENDVLKRVSGAWVSAPGGGVSEPDTQVVFGTGTGVSSSENFTFEAATGKLFVNQTSAPLPTGDVYIYSGANDSSDGYSGLELQRPNATGSSGVYMFAGSGEWGGAMELAAGSGTTSGGGSFYIYSGDGSSSGEILIRTGIADNGNSGGIFLRVQNGSDAGGMIQLNAGNSSGGPGGDIEILAGKSDNNPGTDPGGTIYITAGDTISGTTGVGGNVVISAGQNLIDSNNSGSVTIKTSSNNRVEVNALGAVAFAGNFGNTGEVLTSQGASSPPTWQAAGGGSAVFVYQLDHAASGTFGSTTISTWNAQQVDQGESSAEVTWDSGNNLFKFIHGGMWEVRIQGFLMKDPSDSHLPTSMFGFGIELNANMGAQLESGSLASVNYRAVSSGGGSGWPPDDIGWASGQQSFNSTSYVGTDDNGTLEIVLWTNAYAVPNNFGGRLFVTLTRIGDYVVA